MTLDGLEQVVLKAVPRRSRVNFIRYADDFIITGKSKELLRKNVMPAVKSFLKKRGLTLSKEKTCISHIHDGFNFLSQNFCKHGNKLHITPCKESVFGLVREIGQLIRQYGRSVIAVLIKKLNQKLRGWANYHRHVVSSDVFRRVDLYVFNQLWRMLYRRHSNKSHKWLVKKYWQDAGQKWVFSIKELLKSKFPMNLMRRTSSTGS